MTKSSKSNKKRGLTSEELIERTVKSIEVDRENISQHIIELSRLISQDSTGLKYQQVGTVLVKCLEDSQKANDQMIKIIAAVQRNEEFYYEEDDDDDRDFNSILDRVNDGEEDHGANDTDETE